MLKKNFSSKKIIIIITNDDDDDDDEKIVRHIEIWIKLNLEIKIGKDSGFFFLEIILSLSE